MFSHVHKTIFPLAPPALCPSFVLARVCLFCVRNDDTVCSTRAVCIGGSGEELNQRPNTRWFQESVELFEWYYGYYLLQIDL